MTELLGIFADNLLPIFLIAGAGYLIGEALNLDVRSLALVGFNIFSPCLVFDRITRAQLAGDDIMRMIALAAATLLVTGALAWRIGRAMGLPRRLHAALVLTAMLPNAGNYGLPLNRLAFGEAALGHAGIYFVASAVIMYTVGVLVASLGSADIGTALRGLLRVPAVYAVLIALVVLQSGVNVPLPIDRTVSLLADAAIPTFLVVLGLQLRRAQSVRPSRELALAVGLRLLASPAVALILVPILALSGPGRQAGLVEAAMPTAVATTVLAEAYDVEPAFVTAGVLASTLLSPVTLTPLLAWLGAG